MTTLDALETRVLACLIEKAVTTPEYYPLTLNALVAACGQKSNRDPVMQVDENEVLRALDRLRDKKLAWSVTLAGSRAPKYRHSMLDVLALTPPQLAVLCELMLRGPQTPGELRTHASRLAPLADTGQVQAVLEELAAWPAGALVSRLPRQTGQREERYAHLLGGVPEESRGTALPPAGIPCEDPGGRHAEPGSLEKRLAVVEDEVARLRECVASLLRQLQ